MCSIFANSLRSHRRYIVALIMLVLPVPLFAQESGSLSITLTPPLFQVTQAPGGAWSSVLRVVNTNKFDLVVTATVQDFRPDGESGNALLGSTGSPEDTHLMSGWFTIPEGEIVVPRGSTGEIPFTLSVPINADPGGHYAAVVVATRPGEVGGGSGAGISTAVTSLFFLRVPGEVIEEGAIRDFYAEDRFLQNAEARFALRFENTGNVHLVPEGSIIITNMWGKERGKIDINKVNTFGNVLPDSTRKFEFTWQGESNPFEFGRYKALATLVYGEDGRQTIYRTTYFWVIPLAQVLPFVFGLVGFVWFVAWSLRRYVRKALALERDRLGLDSLPHSPAQGVMTPRALSERVEPSAPRVTLAVLRRPLVEESVDLRSTPTSSTVPGNVAERPQPTGWVTRNRAVVAFLAIVVIGLGMIGWYFVEVFQSEREFQMEQVKE
jgi:hypothetical protein